MGIFWIAVILLLILAFNEVKKSGGYLDISRQVTLPQDRRRRRNVR